MAAPFTFVVPTVTVATENKRSAFQLKPDQIKIIEMVATIIINGTERIKLLKDQVARSTLVLDKLLSVSDILLAASDAYMKYLPRATQQRLHTAMFMLKAELIALWKWVQEPIYVPGDVKVEKVPPLPAQPEIDGKDSTSPTEGTIRMVDMTANMLIRTLTRYRTHYKDPVTRHMMVLDKFLIFTDMIMGQVDANVVELTPSLQEKCLTAMAFVSEELTALSDCIQQPLLSPDHPIGNKDMQASIASAEAAVKKLGSLSKIRSLNED